MELQETTQWLMSKGLTRSSGPLVWLNGILAPIGSDGEESPEALEQEIMYKVAMEQQKLQVRGAGEGGG